MSICITSERGFSKLATKESSCQIVAILFYRIKLLLKNAPMDDELIQENYDKKFHVSM